MRKVQVKKQEKKVEEKVKEEKKEKKREEDNVHEGEMNVVERNEVEVKVEKVDDEVLMGS
ncbi:hypothetical protein [Staphylococcus saprophyticus]|uniref:hypothetical protein n=1 Tax=Staphylococcus saprophyticus TaxID=29385 RepID=UPI0016431223|nr:hypothetical protein [Staphylococcus saprophyticus]